MLHIFKVKQLFLFSFILQGEDVVLFSSQLTDKPPGGGTFVPWCVLFSHKGGAFVFSGTGELKCKDGTQGLMKSRLANSSQASGWRAVSDVVDQPCTCLVQSG
jgi:hypothetical protein